MAAPAGEAGPAAEEASEASSDTTSTDEDSQSGASSSSSDDEDEAERQAGRPAARPIPLALEDLGDHWFKGWRCACRLTEPEKPTMNAAQ